MSARFVSVLYVLGLVGATALAACDPEKAPLEEGVEREELGTFTTDTGNAITFDVSPPSDAVSALVYCGPYGYDMLATAESITAPDGGSVYDLENPGATAMRVDTHSDILPMLIPVSPDLGLVSGTYGFKVYFDTESPVSATCTGVYRVQAVEAEPTIDLDFVFVGVDGIAPGLNAAEGESTLAAVVEEVGAAWGNAGLSIGTITYADFDGNVDDYTILDGDTELGTLLRTVSGDRRTVTFFFVQEITNNEGVTILGLAGGPPGLAAVGGTSKSGVVVTTASFASDPSEVARIMAHEGGHFLGLFHTTEKDGSQHDPLSDTPQCTTDTSGDGVFATNECEGTGADNLMFWTGANDGMSADQGWVLARSAATY